MEMDFGWVEYSAEEILKTLDDLNDGFRDPLGFSVISDYYAGIFFPGISTEQTRARYFVLVPYVFQELKEFNREGLNQKEKELAWNLKKNNKVSKNGKVSYESGIIGINAMKDFQDKNKWINSKKTLATRAPSARYLTGLKKFGILQEDFSITELLQPLKSDIGKQKGDDFSTSDFPDPWGEEIETLYGEYFGLKEKDKKKFSILPTESEATFLKGRICDKTKGSLLAALLEKRIQLKGFKELQDIIKENDFQKFQTDFENAVRFLDFARLLNAYYYQIISNGSNKKAEEIINDTKNDDIIDKNFNPPESLRYHPVVKFMNTCKDYLKENKIDNLKEEIKRQEKHPKIASNPNLLEGDISKKDVPIPNLRFDKAKQIINDILKGLK